MLIIEAYLRRGKYNKYPSISVHLLQRHSSTQSHYRKFAHKAELLEPHFEQ